MTPHGGCGTPRLTEPGTVIRTGKSAAVVLDTQSVHAAAGVPASTTGLDVAKRVPGRKRGLAVDVLGLVIAVTALADRLPARTSASGLPEHPDCSRILAAFGEAPGSLRARDVCEALDHEPLSKNIEGACAS